LVLLSATAMQALIDGDLAAASRTAGVALPAEFLDEGSLWRRRLRQLTDEPGCAPWLARAVVRTGDDVVVGHAGFHGPPDDRGMVEVGYLILAEHRRQGYARRALDELLGYAGRRGARVGRASIAPDNEASQSLVRSSGFVQVGDQWDDEDGLELVFERPLSAD
jgi:RimJ/RimL family protein N-acetyltransferase